MTRIVFDGKSGPDPNQEQFGEMVTSQTLPIAVSGAIQGKATSHFETNLRLCMGRPRVCVLSIGKPLTEYPAKVGLQVGRARYAWRKGRALLSGFARRHTELGTEAPQKLIATRKSRTCRDRGN